MFRFLVFTFFFILSNETYAFSCREHSGNEYICQKMEGFLKIVYDQRNNKIAYVQIDQDFQVASWYPINSSAPIVFDSGDGRIITTPEIRGRAKCGKDFIKFDTVNILDNEKTEVIYHITKDGMIISGDEDHKNIICKKI